MDKGVCLDDIKREKNAHTLHRGSLIDSTYAESLHTSAHSRSCFSLSWSFGGISSNDGGLGLLASSGGDGKIIIWQIVTSQLTEHAKDDRKYAIPMQPAPAITPIAAMRDAHGVSDVNSVAWCLRKDGKGQGMLASAGDDGSVKVWRVINGQ